MRVLHLHETVLTVSDFVALLALLFRAITAAAPSAEMTVIASSQQSIELFVTKLAIWLILDGPDAAVAELDSGDDGWV